MSKKTKKNFLFLVVRCKENIDTLKKVSKKVLPYQIEKDKILPPTPYGEYKNISLTDEEYQKLKDNLQGHTDTMIDKLSRYIESSGKTYKNHYVTILNWYEQDKEKLSQKNNGRTYPTNYEDSDSL